MSETAEFDMTEATNEIAADLFNVEPKEETDDVIEESVDEVEETSLDNEESTEEVEPTEEVEVRAAPASWKKDKHEMWNALTDDQKDYIELREQQMKESAEFTNEDTTFGKTMRDVLSPYSELLKSQNVDEKTAVQYLLNAHWNLSNADEAKKIELFNQMAQTYGINLDGSKVSPEIDSLRQQLNHLQNQINRSQQLTQQEKQAETMKEVEAFASNHEFFDEVAEDIVPFIRSGLTLEEAYEKAIWANSVTRQKEIERLDREKAEALEKEKQEKVEKAKKAKSANVKAKDTNKAPTEPTGKMFDDLNSKYDEIVNR